MVRRPDGELAGLLKDEAMGPVAAAIPDPSPARRDSALTRAMRHANALGVTAVASVSTTWGEIDALRRARDRGDLSLRVSNYLFLADWRATAESLRIAGPGDAWIRTAGVKGMVDGSLGSTTALFYEPYEDEPATSGVAVTPEDSMRAWVGAADSAGLQVVVHAIGERANGILLSIFDSVARAHGEKDRRFRVEHAQHLRREDIERFPKLGVIASMQPYHAIDDGRWAEKRIGPERIKMSYAFRSLLDAGAVLAFGTDWTVAPIDPLLGIQAAVTRQTLDGQNPDGWVPEQKITVEEAVRAYTQGSAYAEFQENEKGTLAPGKLADFVVLSQDIFSLPPDQVTKARVEQTIVGGRVVYTAPSP
jgi:predicted amidohydrolase YtcJ